MTTYQYHKKLKTDVLPLKALFKTSKIHEIIEVYSQFFMIIKSIGIIYLLLLLLLLKDGD